MNLQWVLTAFAGTVALAAPMQKTKSTLVNAFADPRGAQQTATKAFEVAALRNCAIVYISGKDH